MRQAGVAADLIRYLPNGVDTARFRPGDRRAARQRLGMEVDRPRVVFVGRLDPVKALPSLLRAWRTVVEKEPRALLDLVGDGDLQSELQTMARTLGLDRSVLFHGRREDVLPYLQAADCFVLPSSSEGLSNTLLEAMAAGLPVVATRVSGSEDIVVSGRNGFLVSPGDQDDLSRQILAILGDPQLARRLGITARKQIMEAFSIERVAKNYQALYREARSS